MGPIKVAFCDFWPSFDPFNNIFVEWLRTWSEIQVVTAMCHVDLLVYSVFGCQNASWPSRKRVYYTGENTRPPLDRADLCFSFDRISHPKHVRLPLWVLYTDWYGKDPDPEHVKPSVLFERRSFRGDQKNAITLMNSNPKGFRLQLFGPLLQRLKGSAVSLGSYCTSEGHDPVPVGSKLEAISGYKLNLAIENSVHSGYCTEKILQAFAGNTIPVYHGDPDVALDFNPRAFLNINGLSVSEAIDAIQSLLGDQDRMDAMMNEVPLANPDGFSLEPFVSALRGVLQE